MPNEKLCEEYKVAVYANNETSIPDKFLKISDVNFINEFVDPSSQKENRKLFIFNSIIDTSRSATKGKENITVSPWLILDIDPKDTNMAYINADGGLNQIIKTIEQDNYSFIVGRSASGDGIRAVYAFGLNTKLKLSAEKLNEQDQNIETWKQKNMFQCLNGHLKNIGLTNIEKYVDTNYRTNYTLGSYSISKLIKFNDGAGLLDYKEDSSSLNNISIVNSAASTYKYNVDDKNAFYYNLFLDIWNNATGETINNNQVDYPNTKYGRNLNNALKQFLATYDYSRTNNDFYQIYRNLDSQKRNIFYQIFKLCYKGNNRAVLRNINTKNDFDDFIDRNWKISPGKNQLTLSRIFYNSGVPIIDKNYYLNNPNVIVFYPSFSQITIMNIKLLA